MKRFIFARIIWNGKALPFGMPGARWHDLHVMPSSRAPFGQKGLAIDSAWKQIREPGCCGMLLLDGDVAIDPLDYVAMCAAIDAEPLMVHTGAARLWPSSTTKESWSWAHWQEGHGLTQDWTDTPDRFSFCFTYLPRQLLWRASQAGLAKWQFPNVDLRMAETAKACGIKARVVPNCYPKHLHY